MTSIVVADAGPLIGMARIGHLSLLQRLYNSIVIPPHVFEELKISSGRPGARELSDATPSSPVRHLPATCPQCFATQSRRVALTQANAGRVLVYPVKCYFFWGQAPKFSS